MNTELAPMLVGEVAKHAGVSPDTVRDWERSGKLPAVKTRSGVRLFSMRDVERILAERAAEAKV